jgi:hypothetical protein
MNGITFFAVLAAGVIVSLILTHLSDFVQSLTGPTVLQGVGIAALYITFGSLFASAIGGVVGLVFAGIDLILLGIAARIVRARPA